jgi:hypothetical protein
LYTRKQHKLLKTDLQQQKQRLIVIHGTSSYMYPWSWTLQFPHIWLFDLQQELWCALVYYYQIS